MRLLSTLWIDEAGFVISSELVLVATILVIAMVVGLQTIRDAVLQELGDVANAIGNISQDFSFGGVTGHHSAVAGSIYIDDSDFCENSAANNKNCVTTCLPAAAE